MSLNAATTSALAEMFIKSRQFYKETIFHERAEDEPLLTVLNDIGLGTKKMGTSILLSDLNWMNLIF
jgi:hypothetical protein